jgi:hypothetical protein
MDFDYVVPALIVLIGVLSAWLSTLRILSLRRMTYPTWRNVTERIVFSLVTLAAVAIPWSSGFSD